MKGVDSTGAYFVPGWMDGSKSCFKDCLQQSKIVIKHVAFVKMVQASGPFENRVGKDGKRPFHNWT
jgi:hypothetical protein